MQEINVLSLTQDVNDWLISTHHPRILHVFDQACNLINEEKEVLSLVVPQIGNGPFNLVVADNIIFSDHISLETPVLFSPNQLHLGDLTIRTDDASLWNPRPDWEVFYTKQNKIFTQLPSLSFVESAPSVPATLLSTFTTSVVNADIPSTLAVIQKLAGLGVGLTPAGDDLIMGALYAAWIIHPCEVARVLAEKVANTASPMTTSLSAAWIRSAGRGEAGQFWHEFFIGLEAGDKSGIQLSIEKILEVGETSGADAMAGFLSTVQAYMASFSRNAATSSAE